MIRSTLLEPASDDSTRSEVESDGTTSLEELQTTQQRALKAKSKRRLKVSPSPTAESILTSWATPLALAVHVYPCTWELRWLSAAI